MLAPTHSEFTYLPQWALHCGGTKAPLVLVIPDDWPGMYRLQWPDGRLSGMANLTRAKDAAIAICERGPPARNARYFRWHTSDTSTNTVFPRLNGARVV